MKKGKLYTVTPWNKQALVKAEPLSVENLFWPGGSIGNYGGQQITFGTSNYGAAGNPFTPGTTAFNHYNIQSVENSISNGSYFKNPFTYLKNNPTAGYTGNVKGIDFNTNFNDSVQRGQFIQNSAENGLGNWKNAGVNDNGSGSKGKSKGMSAGAQQAIALGASALGSIDTGEKRGMWDTLDPVHHLAGGRETGFGNAMEDAGVALTQAGLSSGNYYLAIAGAAAKVVGGLSNAAFGYKIENEKAVNDNINRLANTNYNADDYDTLLSQDAAMGGRNRVDLGEIKNGWFNSKGTKNAKKLNATQDWALAFGDNSFENAEKNIQQRQLENALRWYSTTDFNRNQSAYGGPLDIIGNTENNMSAVNYGFMSDYLTEKKRQNDLKNKMVGMTQIPNFINNGYAIGGDLQTNGSDFPTGLTYVNAGGSHEENPYEGVQMGVDPQGVPNLVEEGETVFNDYVYSTRIPIDDITKERFHIGKKREMTYADLSKKLEKEVSERPNDPISQAAFKAQMADLAEEQERQKAEMEAARAREAFEALSPEEQTALMQQAAQQEQMAQEQAVQEQAMAEQAAAEQQPTPEEIAMAEQQQQMVQADGSQAALGQAPQMACGGRINKFDEGGMKQKIYNLLKLKTKSDWDAWVKKNGLDGLNDFEDWDNALQNTELINAIAKDNPALRHALENKYDFGLYKPGASGNVTFDDDRGNWDAQTVQGWWGSTDPAWQEVIKNNPNLTKDTKLSKEELANLIRSTDAFKKGTQWLQDSEDNRLNYLKRIINNPGAPDGAVAYARKFIDENGWKEGAARDYETIFNNPSGRAANPGTYWKTPIEAVRNNLANNYVINEDGTVEALEGGLDGLKLDSSYQWADPQTDYTNNYYRRATAANANGQNGTAGNDENNKPAAGTGDDREVVPIHSKLENLRWAGLLGPAVGLGMQALGIGKPDTSELEAAANSAGRYTTASWMPIGDYMRYKPIDRLFEGNRILANARATERNIMNTSGGNRGTAMAGLIAHGYNTQIDLGTADRQGDESNWNKYTQSMTFNRGTNQTNAQAFNRNSEFNADAYNNAARTYAQMKLHAAQAKMDADAGWNQSIYGNVAGLFKGLHDVGTEYTRKGTISDMAATGLFGQMTPNTYIANGMLRYETDEERTKRLAKQKNSGAKGGKIKRKKGFTY